MNPMKELNNLTLQSLNIATESYFVLNEDLTIPLYIDIADIIDYEYNTSQYKVDILRNNVRIDNTGNPFEAELVKYQVYNILDYYFKFIDKRKLFENCTLNFFEYLEKYNIDKYDIFDESEFQRFRNEVGFYINQVKNKFLDKAKELLDYDRDFPKQYNPKESDMPQDVKENIMYPLGMTMIQGDIEYPSNIIFPENINKPVSEHSFREIQLKAMYLHMKNKIEGFLNSYQSWKMEKDRPRDNNKKH